MIEKNKIVKLFDGKFIRVFDLQYAEGRHYYDATRRDENTLTASMSDEEAKNSFPDAVSIVVILKFPGQEPKLMLTQEYRYPVGRFILSVPAGLIDPADKSKPEPLFETARRELFEETGIIVKPTDKLTVINPLLYSSPGMTDESNALVCAVIELNDDSSLTQSNCEGSELFDGFRLLTLDEARSYLKSGRDEKDDFYSIYTWAGLMYFASECWK